MQYARELRLPSTAPLAAVLDGTSRELRALARTAIQIQCLVSELALEVAPTDTAGLKGLQQLDHVTQSIAGIASFLAALAATAPGGCVLDVASAARHVDVADLALRLSLADAAPVPPHRSSGECQFFQD
jgi:hypothetical protein